MCWVCDRSRAASISSKIYMGAGLNWRRAMMRDSAINELIQEFCKLMERHISSDVPLSTAKFGKALLPHGSKSDLHFEALH